MESDNTKAQAKLTKHTALAFNWFYAFDLLKQNIFI